MPHTPGPWKMECIDGQIFIGSEPDSDDFVFGHQIADMVQSRARGTKTSRRVISDARLIIAAPDLLEALKRSLDWLASYPGGSAQSAYDTARAAIAKAEGK